MLAATTRKKRSFTLPQEEQLGGAPGQQTEPPWRHYSSQDFANQLTIEDAELFYRIGRSEYLSLGWTGKDKLTLAPNIVRFTHQFNHDLVQLGNMNGAQAVLAGLQSAPIYRLKKSWALVGKKEEQVYEKLKILLSEEGNWQSLRAFMAAQEPPGIPHIGIFLTDLVYVATVHAHQKDRPQPKPDGPEPSVPNESYPVMVTVHGPSSSDVDILNGRSAQGPRSPRPAGKPLPTDKGPGSQEWLGFLAGHSASDDHVRMGRLASPTLSVRKGNITDSEYEGDESDYDGVRSVKSARSATSQGKEGDMSDNESERTFTIASRSSMKLYTHLRSGSLRKRGGSKTCSEDQIDDIAEIEVPHPIAPPSQEYEFAPKNRKPLFEGGDECVPEFLALYMNGSIVDKKLTPAEQMDWIVDQILRFHESKYVGLVTLHSLATYISTSVSYSQENRDEIDRATYAASLLLEPRDNSVNKSTRNRSRFKSGAKGDTSGDEGAGGRLLRVNSVRRLKRDAIRSLSFDNLQKAQEADDDAQDKAKTLRLAEIVGNTRSQSNLAAARHKSLDNSTADAPLPPYMTVKTSKFFGQTSGGKSPNAPRKIAPIDPHADMSADYLQPTKLPVAASSPDMGRAADGSETPRAAFNNPTLVAARLRHAARQIQENNKKKPPAAEVVVSSGELEPVASVQSPTAEPPAATQPPPLGGVQTAPAFISVANEVVNRKRAATVLGNKLHLRASIRRTLTGSSAKSAGGASNADLAAETPQASPQVSAKVEDRLKSWRLGLLENRGPDSDPPDEQSRPQGVERGDSLEAPSERGADRISQASVHTEEEDENEYSPTTPTDAQFRPQAAPLRDVRSELGLGSPGTPRMRLSSVLPPRVDRKFVPKSLADTSSMDDLPPSSSRKLDENLNEAPHEPLSGDLTTNDNFAKISMQPTTSTGVGSASEYEPNQASRPGPNPTWGVQNDDIIPPRQQSADTESVYTDPTARELPNEQNGYDDISIRSEGGVIIRADGSLEDISKIIAESRGTHDENSNLGLTMEEQWRQTQLLMLQQEQAMLMQQQQQWLYMQQQQQRQQPNSGHKQEGSDVKRKNKWSIVRTINKVIGITDKDPHHGPNLVGSQSVPLDAHHPMLAQNSPMSQRPRSASLGEKMSGSSLKEKDKGGFSIKKKLFGKSSKSQIAPAQPTYQYGQPGQPEGYPQFSEHDGYGGVQIPQEYGSEYSQYTAAYLAAMAQSQGGYNADWDPNYGNSMDEFAAGGAYGYPGHTHVRFGSIGRPTEVVLEEDEEELREAEREEEALRRAAELSRSRSQTYIAPSTRVSSRGGNENSPLQGGSMATQPAIQSTQPVVIAGGVRQVDVAQFLRRNSAPSNKQSTTSLDRSDPSIEQTSINEAAEPPMDSQSESSAIENQPIEAPAVPTEKDQSTTPPESQADSPGMSALAAALAGIDLASVSGAGPRTAEVPETGSDRVEPVKESKRATPAAKALAVGAVKVLPVPAASAKPPKVQPDPPIAEMPLADSEVGAGVVRQRLSSAEMVRSSPLRAGAPEAKDRRSATNLNKSTPRPPPAVEIAVPAAEVTSQAADNAWEHVTGLQPVKSQQPSAKSDQASGQVEPPPSAPAPAAKNPPVSRIPKPKVYLRDVLSKQGGANTQNPPAKRPGDLPFPPPSSSSSEPAQNPATGGSSGIRKPRATLSGGLKPQISNGEVQVPPGKVREAAEQIERSISPPKEPEPRRSVGSSPPKAALRPKSSLPDSSRLEKRSSSGIRAPTTYIRAGRGATVPPTVPVPSRRPSPPFLPPEPEPVPPTTTPPASPPPEETPPSRPEIPQTPNPVEEEVAQRPHPTTEYIVSGNRPGLGVQERDHVPVPAYSTNEQGGGDRGFTPMLMPEPPRPGTDANHPEQTGGYVPHNEPYWPPGVPYMDSWAMQPPIPPYKPTGYGGYHSNQSGNQIRPDQYQSQSHSELSFRRFNTFQSPPHHAAEPQMRRSASVRYSSHTQNLPERTRIRRAEQERARQQQSMQAVNEAIIRAKIYLEERRIRRATSLHGVNGAPTSTRSSQTGASTPTHPLQMFGPPPQCTCGALQRMVRGVGSGETLTHTPACSVTAWSNQLVRNPPQFGGSWWTSGSVRRYTSQETSRAPSQQGGSIIPRQNSLGGSNHDISAISVGPPLPTQTPQANIPSRDIPENLALNQRSQSMPVWVGADDKRREDPISNEGATMMPPPLPPPINPRAYDAESPAAIIPPCPLDPPYPLDFPSTVRGLDMPAPRPASRPVPAPRPPPTILNTVNVEFEQETTVPDSCPVVTIMPNVIHLTSEPPPVQDPPMGVVDLRSMDPKPIEILHEPAVVESQEEVIPVKPQPPVVLLQPVQTKNDVDIKAPRQETGLMEVPKRGGHKHRHHVKCNTTPTESADILPLKGPVEPLTEERLVKAKIGFPRNESEREARARSAERINEWMVYHSTFIPLDPVGDPPPPDDQSDPPLAAGVTQSTNEVAPKAGAVATFSQSPVQTVKRVVMMSAGPQTRKVSPKTTDDPPVVVNVGSYQKASDWLKSHQGDDADAPANLDFSSTGFLPPKNGYPSQQANADQLGQASCDDVLAPLVGAADGQRAPANGEAASVQQPISDGVDGDAADGKDPMAIDNPTTCQELERIEPTERMETLEPRMPTGSSNQSDEPARQQPIERSDDSLMRHVVGGAPVHRVEGDFLSFPSLPDLPDETNTGLGNNDSSMPSVVASRRQSAPILFSEGMDKSGLVPFMPGICVEVTEAEKEDAVSMVSMDPDHLVPHLASTSMPDFETFHHGPSHPAPDDANEKPHMLSNYHRSLTQPTLVRAASKPRTPPPSSQLVPHRQYLPTAPSLRSQVLREGQVMKKTLVWEGRRVLVGMWRRFWCRLETEMVHFIPHKATLQAGEKRPSIKAKGTVSVPTRQLAVTIMEKDLVMQLSTANRCVIKVQLTDVAEFAAWRNALATALRHVGVDPESPLIRRIQTT